MRELSELGTNPKGVPWKANEAFEERVMGHIRVTAGLDDVNK